LHDKVFAISISLLPEAAECTTRTVLNYLRMKHSKFLFKFLCTEVNVFQLNAQ